MNIIVQKFGGTSVSTHEKRQMAVNKILQAKKNGYLPVVVVSAMGREGQPYATDTLLSLLDDEFKKSNHLACDLIMSCGEIISSVVMCNELFKSNIESIPLTGGQAGIITNDNFNNAKYIEVNTQTLLNILRSNKIPIVAGFQGVNKKGYITTLGRGGSDITAVILGKALNAKFVEIYTDVDGIMTADPRIVSNANLIKNISYNEVFQFADQGAKVIHPRAVELAMKSNIPLIIKNTLSSCEGTVISNLVYKKDDNNIVTGITSVDNRMQIKVEFNSEYSYNDLFSILAQKLISVDLINIFPNKALFTIDIKDKEKFINIIDKLNIVYSYIENCSKIAVIGSKMRGIPGVMAKILNTLSKENIKVLQTADSYMTIWCLIETKYVSKAINALHKEFKLGK